MARKSAAETARENAQAGIDGLTPIDGNEAKETKKEPAKEQRSVISALAPESLIKALDARATLTGKTRSDLILEACSQYIKDNPVNEDMVKAFLAMANAE